MNELALFAGAGGGILGGHLLGRRVVCAVEWEPYAASVLVARQNDGILPPFPVWDDVQTFDGRPWRGLVDVVSGGFPCQDISAAGGGQELMAPALECGNKWPASSVRFDLSESKWKTAHCLWEEDLPWSSVILPRWGMTRNGHVLAHPTAERPISATASGLWATPSATDGQRGGYITENMTGISLAQQINTPKRWPTPKSNDAEKRGNFDINNPRNGLPAAVRKFPTPTASASKGWAPNHNRASSDDRLDYTIERESFQFGQPTPPMRLNPQWVEWLMGWPLGWTDLKPLEMDKFREWRQQHSPFFPDDKAAA